MAEKILSTRFLMRNDLSTNWESANPILMKGEFGVALDLNKFKIGDGTTPWNELDFSGASIDDLPRDDYYKIVDETGTADNETLLSENIVSPKQGDIAVIEKYLTTDANGEKKYSHTGYVYDGNNWGAMDGNYNANNVYFKDDMIVTTTVGTITELENGSATFATAGKNLTQVLNSLLAEEKDPTVDTPSVTYTTSNQNGEVGTSYTLPSATFKVTDVGSYTYGPETGVLFKTGDVVLTQGSNQKTNTSDMAANNTLVITATTTGETLFTDSNISYTFSATAKYTQNDEKIPVTNLGNEVPNLQIKTTDMTVANCTATMTGWRKMFMGSVDEYDEASSTKTEVTLDSKTIRGLNLVSKQVTNSAQTFTVPVGATKIIVAFPSSYTTKDPKFEYFTMSWEGFSGFVKNETAIQVADARGTNADGSLNGAVNYTVYTFTHANPSGFEAATQFRVTVNK